jgi:hypothetical protein
MTSPCVYVPLRLDPRLIDPPSPIVVVPGIALHSISEDEIAAGRFGTVPVLPFSANALLRIEAETYESAAQTRLEPKGVYQPNPLVPEGGMFVSASATARWITTSLILNSPFRFDMGPHYRTIYNLTTQREDTVSVGGREFHQARFVPPARVPGHIDQSSLTTIAVRIEEYFRLAPFRMDRIGVALWTYWTAACARYSEQTYLGLCIVLESLLSTNEQEVTHQLAERAAILSRARGADGVGAYRGLKRLYGIRSNIVHGRGTTKEDIRYIKKRQRIKAPLVAEEIELLLHPMNRIVPLQDLMDLWGVTAEIFRTVLLHDVLYEALRSGDDQELDAIYLSALVGGSAR